VLLLNATPGVDLLLTVTRTLQRGSRAGLAVAAGISAGCVAHALAAAFGLAALLALVPAAFGAIQVAGACYLIWLGIGLWRQAARRDAAPEASPAPGSPPRSDFGDGLLTNLLNPKVALFFLAFLPAFVPAASSHKTASVLLLGAWFVAQSFAFLALVVAMAAALGRAAGASAWRRPLQAAGGLLFFALALRLLTEASASTPAAALPR
jgi:threonine/homoserine/homoserine lactone efflux protein